MCPRAFFYPLTFFSFILAASIGTAVETTTEPVGAMLIKVNSPATAGTSRLSLISATFVNPVSYQGAVASLTASTLTVAASPWTASQFNGANGKYYIEITSGAGAGAMSDISATTSNTLTLTDDLTSFGGAASTFRVRKHVTISQVFGANNSAGLLGGQSATAADEIYLYNPQTAGFTTVFYGDFDGTQFDGWYTATFQPAADTIIYPEQGILIRRKQTGSQLQFVFSGSVKPGQSQIPVTQGLNYLGMINAAGLQLQNLGLYTGNAATGIQGGQSATASDEIAVIGSDGGFKTYFYGDFDGTSFDGWYDATFNPSNSVTINPGDGIFIRRKSPGAAFNWTVPSAY